MDAGTNSTADTLIQARLAPDRPNAWTANQLRTKLFGGNFDIAVLTGHFSAGSLLAAGLCQRAFRGRDRRNLSRPHRCIVLALAATAATAFQLTICCAGISPYPDWAKAFLRKGAAGYISATGYAYGDTEFVEYGERLFLRMAQQLRTGSGPISIGQAVVKAKQQFLAETAQLTGIDQKTLVEMTLRSADDEGGYARGASPPPAENSIVGSVTPVTRTRRELRSAHSSPLSC